MEELLKKYYEYFNARYSKAKQNFNYQKELNAFYNIIINADFSENQVKIDIQEFFEFFDSYNGLTGCYSTASYFFSKSYIEPKLKEQFEKKGLASFEWFEATNKMVKDKYFVYSINAVNGIFCKAYLSIKPENYVKVLIKLQSFIDGLYNKYPYDKLGQCKFRKYPANDAIVMRFSKEQHYNDFLEFLNENKDIIESFDTPNLFIPRNEYGVSVISDTGGSYNYFVAKTIFDYMIYCKKNNINISIEGISEFISNYECQDDEILELNTKKVNDDFKSILIGKLNSTPDQELLKYVFGSKDKTLKYERQNS